MSWLHVPDQQTPFLTTAGTEQERQRSGKAVMVAKQHHNPSNSTDAPNSTLNGFFSQEHMDTYELVPG